MSALDELQRRHIAPAWLLEIDGISERYYSGFAPAATAVPAPFVAVFGIESVDIGEASLNLTKSIVEDGAASVRLVITRDNGIAANLLRLEASRSVTLVTTVPAATGATTVTVLESNAGWPVPGELWVGQECMHYTATAGAGPYTFTVNAGDRGYYGSQIQEHRVEGAEGWNPKVTDECVAWRGRRARVKIAAGRRDGQTPTSDYITEVNGFIDLSPRSSGDLSLELTVVPDTARLERELGGDEVETGLQHGFHAWAKEGEHLFSGHVAVKWGDGDLWESATTANAGPGGPGPIPVENVEALVNVHDFGTTTTIVGFSDGQTSVATGVTVVAPGPAGTVTTPEPAAGRLAGAKLQIPAFVERIGAGNANPNAIDVTGGAPAPVSLLVPVITGWPDEVLDTIHEITSQPLAGATGRKVRVLIAPRGNGPAALLLRANYTQSTRFPEVEIRSDLVGLWYGIDLRDPDTPVPRNLYNARGGVNSDRRAGWTRPNEKLVEDGAAGIAALQLNIRGVADAFHQNRENYVWVRENVFRTPTPTSPVYISVAFTEGDDEVRTHLKTTGIIQASTIVVGLPGWLLLVPGDEHGQHLSFGDWPGEDESRIREVVEWRDETPNTVILQLLLSGQGTGINDPTYDVLPYGANLDGSSVDITGIENYPTPVVALQQSFVLEDAVSIEDIIAPMLRLMGAVMVHRVNQVTGARLLTLVEVSAPNALDARAVIGEGDWSVKKRPTTETDDNIVNLIIYKLNFSDDGEDHYEVKIADRDSIGRYEEVGTLEEDLLGMRLPQGDPAAHRAALLQPALAYFSDMARPRRIIKATIAASDALLLDCGSVVTLTASDVYAVDGSLGVTEVQGRVLAKRQQWDKNESELTIRLYDYSATGWAPSLEVAAVIGPNEVQVQPNAYTLSLHPITDLAQTDLEYWAVGDVARAIPAGDYGGSTAGLIATVVTATNITFNAPHGLVAGDTIRPDDYGPASTAHERDFAFLADDAGVLGPAADPAKVYS